MGYFGYGTLVMIINVAIITFLAITYFKEVYKFMEEEDIGYYGYNDYDGRHWILILTVLASCLLSWLLWPIMLVVWVIGILYIAIKQNEKFKKIIEILKETPENNKKYDFFKHYLINPHSSCYLSCISINQK